MSARKAKVIARLNEFLSLPDKAPLIWHKAPASVKWRRANRFAERCLRVWARSSAGLPGALGLEDMVAAKLLKTRSPKELRPFLAYVATRLRDVAASRRPYAFERSLSAPHWAYVCLEADAHGTSHEIVGYLGSRVSSGNKDIYLRAWEGCVGLTDLWEDLDLYGGEAAALRRLSGELREHSERQLLSLMLLRPGDAEWFAPRYVEIIRRHLDSLKPISQDSPWHPWFEAWVEGIPEAALDDGALDILSEVLDAELCSSLLEGKKAGLFFRILRARRAALVMKITELAPGLTFRTLRAHWSPENEWEEEQYAYGAHLSQLLPVMSHSGEELVKEAACTLGYLTGRHCQEKGLDPGDPGLVESFLDAHDVTFAHLPAEVYRQAHLWAILRRIAGYASKWKTEAELLGAELRLREFVTDHPDEWARALPAVLLHKERLHGTVEAMTVMMHDRSADVRGVLKSSAADGDDMKVRDAARGLLAVCDGMNTLQEEVAFDFVSRVARLFDGYTSFPHPLEIRSGTWLGSTSVETSLRQTIRQSEVNFQRYFKSQGSMEEEAPTAVLLNELDAAFRSQQLQVKGFGLEQSRKLPRIKFSQMQVKKKDEKVYGCDVSFILKGNIHQACRIESAELVQVKKPEFVAEPEAKGGRFRDAWRITVKQLGDILNYSQTAVYWLIQPDGQVIVVPAKLLQGIVRGTGKSEQGSVTVGYHQLRAASVSLDQFMVDLFLGLWVGTSAEATLRFARGEETMTKPMHVIVIDVTLGGEQG